MKKILQEQMIKRKISNIDPWYELVIKMLNYEIESLKRKVLVEIGCGFGGFCIYAACKGAHVIGLDISITVVKKAKELAKKFQDAKMIEFIVGDAQHLPFKDEIGEIVICSETLEHVSDSEKAFAELVRITRNFGYLCVTVPNMLSTMFLEYLILSIIGQPQYARDFMSVEKEHIFHVFKIYRLIKKYSELNILQIQSADLIHLPPRLREKLGIEFYVKVISNNLQRKIPLLNLFGATIGFLAKKRCYKGES